MRLSWPFALLFAAVMGCGPSSVPQPAPPASPRLEGSMPTFPNEDLSVVRQRLLDGMTE